MIVDIDITDIPRMRPWNGANASILPGSGEASGGVRSFAEPPAGESAGVSPAVTIAVLLVVLAVPFLLWANNNGDVDISTFIDNARLQQPVS